jgi:hypothetical protein
MRRPPCYPYYTVCVHTFTGYVHDRILFPQINCVVSLLFAVCSTISFIALDLQIENRFSLVCITGQGEDVSI